MKKKVLPCQVCGVEVKIPDKYRMAKKATCGECSRPAVRDSPDLRPERR